MVDHKLWGETDGLLRAGSTSTMVIKPIGWYTMVYLYWILLMINISIGSISSTRALNEIAAKLLRRTKAEAQEAPAQPRARHARWIPLLGWPMWVSG